MRLVLLTIAFALGALAQTGPILDAKEIHRIGPAAPDPHEVQLSPAEIKQLRMILDRVFPPSLVGQTLPEKIRSKKATTIAVYEQVGCVHCANENPFLAELEKSSTNPEVEIRPFFSPDSDLRKAVEFLKMGGVSSAPVIADAQDMQFVGPRGTPQTVVADRNGKVIAAYSGELNDKARDELRKLVAAK